MRIPKPLFDNLAAKSFLRPPNANYLRRGLFAVNLRTLFAVPCFDAESERLFWQERFLVLLTPLKSALVLGASAFLAYILLDVYTGNIKPTEALLRLPIVLVLFWWHHERYYMITSEPHYRSNHHGYRSIYC